MKLKVKLVSEWKECWKFASVRMSTLGAVLMATADTANQVFMQLPPELREHVPQPTTVAMTLFLLTIVGRVLTSRDDEDGNS